MRLSANLRKLTPATSPASPPRRSRRPILAAAEEKMAQYRRLGEDAWAAGTDCDVLFVRVR